MKYDSKQDTENHIKRVQELIFDFSKSLALRGVKHDKSKLSSPEKEVFDEFTPRLKGLTYGSQGYRENMEELRVAIDHHQKNNSHHPEFYKEGLNGFDLLDLVEMFLDWKAATERHNDGNIFKSIEFNKERFGMSEQLCSIFRNTATRHLELELSKPETSDKDSSDK